MAKKGDIYLGASSSEVLLSAFGRELTISDMQITREGRTASGKLVKEIIATKKKFRLAYDLIDGNDLQTFIDIYELDSELNLFLYNSDYGEATTTTPAPGDNCESYLVLMKPIDRTRAILTDDGLWSGVNVELEEV